MLPKQPLPKNTIWKYQLNINLKTLQAAKAVLQSVKKWNNIMQCKEKILMK